MVIVGDCRERLREMADGSVQTCVTSPPYFGLRSYLPDMVKMRDDLTDEERAYLESELAKLGINPTMGVL